MRLTAVQNGCLWLALYALSAKAVSASRKEYWVGTAAQCEKGCVSWNPVTFQTKTSEAAAANELKRSFPESRAISALSLMPPDRQIPPSVVQGYTPR